MIISTNFRLETDKINFSRLDADFQLYKYHFDNYDFRKKNDFNLYKKLIIAYKDKFDFPFYFLAPKNGVASFYVLYPKSLNAPNFDFEDLKIKGEPHLVGWHELLQPNEKGVRDKIHILVKILLSQYLYEIEIDDKRRICQGDFYVFGKKKGDYVTTAVKLEVRHDKSIGEQTDEFHIIPHAVDFVVCDKPIDYDKNKHFFEPYFEKIDELPSYFRQLRPYQIQDFVKDKNKLWKLKKTSTKSRAELEWHIVGENMESTRGYITYNFQEKFI